jgi:ribosomal RNA assembly protein
MIKLIVDKITRITKNRKKLEEVLNVEIINRGKEVSIEGEAKDEFIAEKVIDALNFGFPYSAAIEIKTEDLVLDILNIKEYTNQKNLERVRGRVIGRGGKTLKTLSNLTNCYLELKENRVGIIGEPEFIKNAQEALISLIKGSKAANVYAYLEKHRPEPLVDLGLKDPDSANIVE